MQWALLNRVKEARRSRMKAIMAKKTITKKTKSKKKAMIKIITKTKRREREQKFQNNKQ